MSLRQASGRRSYPSVTACDRSRNHHARYVTARSRGVHHDSRPALLGRGVRGRGAHRCGSPRARELSGAAAAGPQRSRAQLLSALVLSSATAARPQRSGAQLLLAPVLRGATAVPWRSIGAGPACASPRALAPCTSPRGRGAMRAGQLNARARHAQARARGDREAVASDGAPGVHGRGLVKAGRDARWASGPARHPESSRDAARPVRRPRSALADQLRPSQPRSAGRPHPRMRHNRHESGSRRIEHQTTWSRTFAQSPGRVKVNSPRARPRAAGEPLFQVSHQGERSACSAKPQ
ncbi:hypothetical protein Amir_6510 [Actinosynnema mirum DSM 43827]|uniref:Uncharacterized protein n=1 Tax=Actinosynnema mirum (strain ATCC 29888 / DSM 43827 / JCM 3225 / NBRC 14064 / NCIMB 13271 / NRRL B-12336 / IMRU 3971 / 101) TaxID=446462 RepID=C6WLS5_ACTMD|nr:hypothetical protein Amir_6510 [Actinosynnema mirum DSM 43827]